MQVSVIIPVYNSQAWLRNTLEAVQSQSLTPAEIIVVDDGSTDNSCAIAKEFSNVVLLRNPLKGANTARSWGLKHSGAPYAAFLDSDDIWHPDHLNILAGIFAANPSLPAAVSSSRPFFSGGEKLFQAPASMPVSFQPWDSFPFTGVDTPSVMVIQRQALATIGGLPTMFGEICENHMALKLSAASPLIKNRSITVGRRMHQQQLSNRLRLSDPEGYLRHLLASLEHVLTYRSAFRQDDAELLRHRLYSVNLMQLILHALIVLDPQALELYAQKLLTHTAGQPEFFIKRAYQSLAWWILPVLYRQAGENQRSLTKILLAGLPEEAEGIRTMVVNSLPALRSGLSP